MHFPGRLPFRGRIIWLTPEQGGRSSGPPTTPVDQDYASTAFVPPRTVSNGLASFVLRVDDRTAWNSPANAGWLIVENTGVYRIQVGSVVVVTEGSRAVGHFHVDEVLDAEVAMPAAGDLILEVEPLTYYSYNDEAAFFEWLDKLPCVTSYRGRGRALFIAVNVAAVDDEAFRDLLALYQRYGLSRDPLRRLAPERFTALFETAAPTD
ncbi:hypothetical protein [Nocardia sp. NPDC004711]